MKQSPNSIARMVFLGMVLAISTLAIAGQQKNAPSPTGRIEGVIVDGISDKPLAGVSVSALQEKDRRSIVTDAQGRFTFTLTYGTVRLLAGKDGYAPARPEGRKFPTDGILFAIGPGQQVRGLKIRIFPAGLVTGTVYDSKPKPVQYARVQLLRYWYDDDGVRSLRPVTTGKGGETNDHGEFRIDAVDPGDYFVQVTPPLLSERDPGEPFLSSRAIPVTIKSGSETHVDDLTLPSVRGGSIRIHLVNQTGDPIQNTLNKYLRWMSKDTPAATVVIPLLIMGGPERAEIPAAPGTYEVVAGWSKGNTAPIGVGHATVEVGRTNVNVELTVTKGVAVELQMPPGVRCDLTSDVFGTVTAFDNIQPGLYRVSCSTLPSDAYVSQIRQGGRDVMKEGFQVSAGGDNTAIVSIGRDVGTAEGVVTDSKGAKAAGILVALVPDDAEAKHLYRSTTTDQNGGFTLRTIAPGGYRVFAWTELEGAAYKNSEFMKKYESAGTALKLEAKGKAVVAVKLLD